MTHAKARAKRSHKLGFKKATKKDTKSTKRDKRMPRNDLETTEVTEPSTR